MVQNSASRQLCIWGLTLRLTRVNEPSRHSRAACNTEHAQRRGGHATWPGCRLVYYFVLFCFLVVPRADLPTVVMSHEDLEGEPPFTPEQLARIDKMVEARQARWPPALVPAYLMLLHRLRERPPPYHCGVTAR